MWVPGAGPRTTRLQEGDHKSRPYHFVLSVRQIRSGNRMMNLSRFGIFTFGSVCAFITSFSPISLLSASR